LMNIRWAAGMESSKRDSEAGKAIVAKSCAVEVEPTLSILTTLWQNEMTVDCCCEMKDCHYNKTRRDYLLLSSLIVGSLKTDQMIGATYGELWYIQSILESCSVSIWELDGTTPNRKSRRTQVLQFAMEFKKALR